MSGAKSWRAPSGEAPADAQGDGAGQYYHPPQPDPLQQNYDSWTYASQENYTYSPAAAAAFTHEGTQQQKTRAMRGKHKRPSPTNKRLRRLPPVKPRSPQGFAHELNDQTWAHLGGDEAVAPLQTHAAASISPSHDTEATHEEAAFSHDYLPHVNAGTEAVFSHEDLQQGNSHAGEGFGGHLPVRHISLDEHSTQRVVSELVHALSNAPPKLRATLGQAFRGPDMPGSPTRRERSSIAPGPPAETEGLLKEIKDFQSRQGVSFEARERIRRTSMLNAHARSRTKSVAEPAARRPSAQEPPSVRSSAEPMTGFRATVIPSPSALRMRAKGLGNFLSGLGTKMRKGSVTPLSAASFRKHGSALNDIQELNALKQSSTQRYLAETEDDAVSGKSKSDGSCDGQSAPKPLSEAELRKLYPDLWESFRRYDADGDGTVSSDELISYLEVELDSTIAVEDITKFFDAIDDNGDGCVSFKELADWYHSIVHSLDMDAEAQQGVTVGTIFDVTKFHIGDMAKSIRNPAHANSSSGVVVSEFDEWEEPSRYVIHPYSSFHVTWDLAISAILVFTLVTLPLSLAFEDFNEHMAAFNLTVDIVFCMDIAKNFFTGYVDADGVTYLKHAAIVRHYVLTWFFPDLVSSVPIDLILDAFTAVEGDALTRSTKSLKLIRLVRMTKLFRLLRMGRAAKYFSHWQRFIEDNLKVRIHDSTIRMFKLGVLLLVLAHWIGCIQFMMCRLMDFPSSSWVVAAGLDSMPETKQYSWSFFKALAQMIGIGFETPPITNLSCLDLADSWCTIEMWITLGSMYLGSVFYAIMISNISSIIFSMNMASRLYQEKTQQLNEYMRSKRLPPHLRDRVRDYFSLRYSEGKIFNEEAIMKDLSPSLRRDILIFTSRELFLKVPFFRECTGNGFISSLATSLTPMVAFQNDVIIEEGTAGDSMFFISSGKILIYVEEFQHGVSGEGKQQERSPENLKLGAHSRSKAEVKRGGSTSSSSSDEDAWLMPKTVPLASISAGSFFGEVALILPVRRTASAKATAVSILYMLDRDALLTSLKDFPDIYARLRDIATSRVRRVTRKLRARAQNGSSSSKGSSAPGRRNTLFSLERDLQDVEAVTLNKQKSQ